MSQPANSLTTYQYPRTCPKSALYQVRANGQGLFVHATGVADFACISFSGRVEIEVEVATPITSAFVRPLSRGIKHNAEGSRLRFSLDGPANLQIEINGLKHPLHFYGNPPEENPPGPDDPLVHYFRAGQIYEVGQLELKDNETLYLEGGAIVRGSVVASGARNIRIGGRGVLDGSYYRDERRKFVVLDHCENVRIDDIIMIEPTLWMLVLGACRDVRVTNLKEIGQVVSSDGIDIVGSKDVVIDGCFLKNNDDCIVVKSYKTKEPSGEYDWAENVDNIVVQNCTLMNDGAGNAMEIGHELRCDSIRNITFRNIDVLHVHGLGAVFSIHNSDRARISEVTWEDIRVEHCYDMFIDLRVLQSMWGRDERRGSIENINLKNIRWLRTIFNPGYTKSIMGGWDTASPIRNVVIEDIYFDDRKITNQDELDLFTKSTTGLLIK